MSQNIDTTLNRSTHNRMINNRIISVNCRISFVFLLKIKVAKQSGFTFFVPIVVNLFHIFLPKPVIFITTKAISREKKTQKVVSEFEIRTSNGRSSMEYLEGLAHNVTY